MANKFTGITSAGVNVPVYDKEAHQALGNVYTKSEVDTELNTKQDNLSTEQLYNIEHALTTSAGLASEAWVNNQGFAKESDIPTTAGLMEESKLSINSNHITAYNGIPFSAQGGGGGGATYEGVAPIVVDNTENKISADTIDVNYQQFTHDDSLVHVSNDAQYALGVNTRMFKDETVLWEGEASTGTITLSESLFNFETVKFIVSPNNYDRIATVNEYSTIKNRSQTNYFYLHYENIASNKYIKQVMYCSTTSGKDIVLNAVAGLIFSDSTITHSNPNSFLVLKVVGIGRKGGV